MSRLEVLINSYKYSSPAFYITNDTEKIPSTSSEDESSDDEEEKVPCIQWIPSRQSRSRSISCLQYYSWRERWTPVTKKACKVKPLPMILADINNCFQRLIGQNKIDLAFAYRLDAITTARVSIPSYPYYNKAYFKTMKRELKMVEHHLEQYEFSSKNYILAVLFQHDFWINITASKKDTAQKSLYKGLKCINYCEASEWTAWLWIARAMFYWHILDMIPPQSASETFGDIEASCKKCSEHLKEIYDIGGKFTQNEYLLALQFLLKAKLKIPWMTASTAFWYRCLDDHRLTNSEIDGASMLLEETEKELFTQSEYLLSIDEFTSTYYNLQDKYAILCLRISQNNEKENLAKAIQLLDISFDHSFTPDIKDYIKCYQNKLIFQYIAAEAASVEKDDRRTKQDKNHSTSPASSDFNLENTESDGSHSSEAYI